MSFPGSRDIWPACGAGETPALPGDGFLQALLLLQGGLRHGQAGNGHPERGTTDVVEIMRGTGWYTMC